MVEGEMKKCKCGFLDPAPVITGIYTIVKDVPYGMGMTCKGCGTDRLILWEDASESERHAARLAELSKDAKSEMAVWAG